MKIICFRGSHNCGKSETIKRVLNQYFKIKRIPLDKKEVNLIFTWKDKKVIICSQGDSENEIQKLLLDPLKTEKCEIIICACHKRNSAFRLLDEEFGERNIDFIECPRGEESEEEYNRRVDEFKKLI